MAKEKRLINQPSFVSLIYLKYKSGRGWIAETSHGETAFVIGDAVGRNGQQGDCLVAALETHQNAPHSEPDFYAAWAIPEGEVNYDTVMDALGRLRETDALRGSEIGIGNGDILYHAGLVAKFVKQDRRTELDAGSDIWYSVTPDDCEVGIFEDA